MSNALSDVLLFGLKIPLNTLAVPRAVCNGVGFGVTVDWLPNGALPENRLATPDPYVPNLS